MSLKPKAVRRLLLLGGLALTLVVLVLALVFVRSWQNQRRADRLRADGMAALQRADFPVVLDNLASYLRRKPQDREAWLAFAEARVKVEEANGGHLPQAAVAYRRAWALDEKDSATARKLLKLYGEIGFFAEARDLAMTLRPADADLASAGPDLADVLLEECSARISLKAFDKTLDALTARLVALAPSDYRATLIRASCLVNSDRKDDAVALAAAALSANPDDPRFQFADLFIRETAGRPIRREDLPRTLAGLAGFKTASVEANGKRETQILRERDQPPRYADPEFALRLASAFEAAGLQANAVEILRDAAQRLRDPIARTRAARRQWEYGLAEDLLKDFPAPDLSVNGEDASVLAFLALACRDQNRADQAAQLAAALKARTRSFAANAWSALLDALPSEDPKKRLEGIDAAIKLSPAEPVFHYYRGDALRALGRTEDARQAWNAAYASPLAAAWSTPAARIAESFLDEGRFDEALQAAQLAASKDAASGPSVFISLRAASEAIQAGKFAADKQRQLEDLDSYAARLRRDLAGTKGQRAAERLHTPARVALLAALGRKAEAVAEIQRALDTQDLVDPDLSRRLARLSLTYGLGLEDKLLAAADSGSLLDRALLLDARGQRPQALQLLDEAAKTALPADRAQVATVRAQFLDAIASADALAAWRSAIDAFPDSIPVTLAALRSSSVPGDRALVDKLAERLTALGGSDPNRPAPDIRLARARSLLAGSPELRARDEALAILRALTVEAPSRTDVRDCLVDALLLDAPAKGFRADFPAAVEQLTAAAAVARDRAPYTLRLAQVLEASDKRPDAVNTLSSLALDASARTVDRLRAVDMLAAYGAFDAALRGVSAARDRAAPDDGEILFREATLLTRLDREREAVDAYQRLLKTTLASPAMILSAALDLRRLGQPAAADAALAKLDNPAIQPFERALTRGAFLAATNDHAKAAEEFARATSLAPAEPRTWSASARFLRDRGQLAPAEAAARAGLAAIPGNPDLEVVLQQILLAGKSDDDADLLPLAEALAKDPASRKRGEALRAIAQAKKDGRLKDPATLIALAKNHPDDPVTQLYASRSLAALGPSHRARAATLLLPAVRAFKDDLPLQQFAAGLMLDVRNAPAALDAARNWFRLADGAPPAAIALAEAQLAGNDAAAAAATIRPLLRDLPQALDDNDPIAFGLRSLSVRTDVLRDQTPRALQNLSPLLKSSSRARSALAVPVAAESLKSADDVVIWLELVGANTPADAVDELLRLAQGWRQASARFPQRREQFLRAGLAVTQRLTSPESAATFNALALQSSLHQLLGDTPSAIASGRAALAKAPDSPAALTGLSALLLASNADPGEAVALAAKARDLAPTEPEPLFALANAHLAQAARAPDAPSRTKALGLAAAAAKTLAQLSAQNPPGLLRAAALLEQVGEADAATQAYEQVLAATDGSQDPVRAVALNNLAFILYSRTDQASLDRAKALIDEAVRILPSTDFLETLGLIESARKDRDRAIAAYRRSLELAAPAKPPASLAGLAAALAEGDPKQRTEAADLIRELDASASANQLSPLRRTMLDRARHTLGLTPPKQ